jgi:hypothetical protein
MSSAPGPYSHPLADDDADDDDDEDGREQSGGVGGGSKRRRRDTGGVDGDAEAAEAAFNPVRYLRNLLRRAPLERIAPLATRSVQIRIPPPPLRAWLTISNLDTDDKIRELLAHHDRSNKLKSPLREVWQLVRDERGVDTQLLLAQMVHAAAHLAQHVDEVYYRELKELAPRAMVGGTDKVLKPAALMGELVAWMVPLARQRQADVEALGEDGAVSGVDPCLSPPLWWLDKITDAFHLATGERRRRPLFLIADAVVKQLESREKIAKADAGCDDACTKLLVSLQKAQVKAAAAAAADTRVTGGTGRASPPSSSGEQQQQQQQQQQQAADDAVEAAMSAGKEVVAAVQLARNVALAPAARV